MILYTAHKAFGHFCATLARLPCVFLDRMGS